MSGTGMAECQKHPGFGPGFGSGCIKCQDVECEHGYQAGCVKCKEKEIQTLKELLRVSEARMENRESESQSWAHEFKKAEKERDGLKKQLATTRSNYLFQISEQDAEIERLNERLARIAEALRSFDPSDESENYQYSFGLRKNALSSYDPKWIESVRAEAQLEVWEEVERQRDKLIPQAFKVFLDTRIAEYRHAVSNQPNQSREKRG